MRRPGVMIREVLHSALRKAATVRYPAVKSPMPEGFRGRVQFDAEKCIGCKMCMRDCPSGAIVITKLEDGRLEAHIDMAKCIYCGQCVDSCPKAALEVTGAFELAQLQRDKLRQTYGGEPKSDTEKKP